MPTTTIANVVKHADLTMEQITEIEKNIKVVNKTEAFWNKFVQHDKTPDCDKIKYRKQVLIDPSNVATLTEGVIPAPEQIKVLEFSDSLFNVGSYIKYTRENLKNIDSIVEMGMNQLSHDRLYDCEMTKFNAYKGTTCAVTKGASDTWAKTLLKLKTRLMKNHAKPAMDGTFVFVAPGEITNQIVEEAGTKLTGTEAGAKVYIEGFVGKYSGFTIIERDTNEMYYSVTSGTNESKVTTDHAYALAFGKNEFGEFPVKARDFAGENASVINKGVDSDDKDDPLNQYGTIGSRIDGIGAKLTNAECVFKFDFTLSAGEKIATDYSFGANEVETTSTKVEVTTPSAIS